MQGPQQVAPWLTGSRAPGLPAPGLPAAKEEAGRPALPSLLTPFFPLTLSLPRAQGVPEREAAPGSGRVCRSPAHSPACRRGSPVHLTQPAGQVSCLQHRHWQKCHFFSRPACWWSLTVAPHCRALRARGPGTCGSGPGRRRPRPQLGGALGRAGSSWRGDVSASAGRGFLASGRSLFPSASWLCSFTFGAQPPGPPSDSPGGGSPPPGLEWLFLLLLPLRALLVALVPALGLEFGTVPQRAVTPCGRWGPSTPRSRGWGVCPRLAPGLRATLPRDWSQPRFHFLSPGNPEPPVPDRVLMHSPPPRGAACLRRDSSSPGRAPSHPSAAPSPQTLHVAGTLPRACHSSPDLL